MKQVPAAALAALSALLLPPSAPAQSTLRVSVDSTGIPGWGSIGNARVLSDDGRYVAFHSLDPYLVPNDTNGFRDVFVHDRQLGTTERVSLSPTGAEGDRESLLPSISADGRYVAFISRATNFGWFNPQNKSKIYVRDRVAGTTEKIDVSSIGTHSSNGTSYDPSISADGRYVAFSSTDWELAADDNNFTTDVFVRDRLLGTTTLVSVGTTGQLGTLPSYQPRISRNGRYVTFMSSDSTLTPGITNNTSDAFRRDLWTNTTIRISVGTGGVEGTQALAAVPADEGRWVAFESWASNFAPDDTNGSPDVFLRDVVNDVTTLVSRDIFGNPGQKESRLHNISADGRYIGLSSRAPNFTVNDPDLLTDCFLLDAWSGTHTLVSVDTFGTKGSGLSSGVAFTPDRQHIAFVGPDNLAPGLQGSLYVRDLTVASPQSTYCTAKTNSLGCVPGMAASGLPSLAGADTFHAVATGLRTSATGLFFWGLTPAAKPYAGGFRCVQAPLIRTPLQNSRTLYPTNQCSGTYSFHFSQSYMASRGLSAGTTVYGQYWSRDYGSIGDVGLTDGLSFSILP